MDDLIRRQAAIDALWKALYEYEDKTEKQFQESDELDVGDWMQHRIFVQNMSDIDRQTILALPSAERDYKYGEWCTDCKEYDQERHCCPRFNHVIRTAIDDIVADRKKEEWIPCSERLPEEGKEVLISSDSGLYIAELEILEGNVYWNETIEYRSVKRVSAWCPLPEPYKGEEA